MIRKEEVYKIGRLGKVHGIKGEISFLLDDDVFDRVDADYLVLDVDGILVPFFIEEYRFKTDVYFPRALAESDEDNLSWAEMIGYSLVDAQSGQKIGTIAAVDDSTINILFELEDGRLIPASEELITNIDTQKHQIEINLPEGILEL